jgi:protein O-mannosyl-transferase
MNAAVRRVVFLLLVVNLLTYVPFLGGGLLTDDFVHLARLDDVRSFGQLIATPDAFGFYRPLTQASLALDTMVFGGNAAAFRAESLVLHGLVLIAAVVVSRLLLSPRAAAAAVIAFALTPKAHPIAVLWLSARGELLMSLFSLCAVAAWINWSRGRGRRWLAAAAICYVLALLSKEAAILLPVLLVLAPGATIPTRSRVAALLFLVAVGAALFWWRAQTGALLPLSHDPHYNLEVRLFRLWRNAQNYTARMLPGPLVLLAATAAAFAIGRSRPPVIRRYSAALPTFLVAWMAILLAPVLGIVARNELYLYLPVFGACLLAAHAAAPWIDRLAFTRAGVACLIISAAALAAYQVSRSASFHDDLVFSARLADALAAAPALRGHRGPVTLVAADANSNRFLQDAIGGYLPVVARRVLGPAAFSTSSPAIRLQCDYRDGRVRLQPL